MDAAAHGLTPDTAVYGVVASGLCATDGKPPSTSITRAGGRKVAGALEGLKVLDLSRVVAGPMCAMMLADLGADVIKVERPGGGDDTRQWGPPFVGTESAYYLCLNRNKRSVTADLKSEAGRNLVRRLAVQSDVLVAVSYTHLRAHETDSYLV